MSKKAKKRKRRFRQNNTIRTDTIEFLIALNRHIPLNGEGAIRVLAERIGAPIREEMIDKEFEKIVRDFKKSDGGAG